MTVNYMSMDLSERYYVPLVRCDCIHYCININVALFQIYQCFASGLQKEDLEQSITSILQLLLWGTVTSYDSAVIRLALQGIQHCAVAHVQSRGYLHYINMESFVVIMTFPHIMMFSGGGGVIVDNFLDHCQEVFLEFLFGKCGEGVCATQHLEGGVTSLGWNRIDSFSYTFLVIIAYNSSRYDKFLYVLLVASLIYIIYFTMYM